MGVPRRWRVSSRWACLGLALTPALVFTAIPDVVRQAAGQTVKPASRPLVAPAPPPTSPESGRRALPVTPPLATRLVLDNGLVLLVAGRPGLPIVTVKVDVAAGATLDPPDRAGLANLTALLLTRGTAARMGPEVDRAIEFVGGSLEAEGGRDATELTLAVLKKDWSLGLDLLADALRRPAFSADEFTRKREEVQAAVRQGEEDPDEVAGRLLRRLVFPSDPYGRPVTGTEASLARISRDDVVRFHARAYRPPATVVAVVGDVTVDEARQAIAARLGDWRVTGPRPGALPPVKAVLRARTETVSRDLTQATVLLGQASVGRGHPDYYPLLVGSYLLGGGSSSRLYTRVREERGLAYSIDAELAAGARGGFFVVEFQSRNARVKEVLGLVREELSRLRREAVSSEDLERAKAYLVGSFPLRMDTNAEWAALLLRIERFGLGLDYPARYRRAVEGVTAADVLRVARARLDPARMSLAVVGNVAETGMGGS
jgi:zinc protease